MPEGRAASARAGDVDYYREPLWAVAASCSPRSSGASARPRPALLLTALILVLGALARVSTSPAFLLATPLVAAILLARVLAIDDGLGRREARRSAIRCCVKSASLAPACPRCCFISLLRSCCSSRLIDLHGRLACTASSIRHCRLALFVCLFSGSSCCRGHEEAPMKTAARVMLTLILVVAGCIGGYELWGYYGSRPGPAMPECRPMSSASPRMWPVLSTRFGSRTTNSCTKAISWSSSIARLYPRSATADANVAARKAEWRTPPNRRHDAPT